jgi:hypothetical protein
LGKATWGASPDGSSDLGCTMRTRDLQMEAARVLLFVRQDTCGAWRTKGWDDLASRRWFSGDQSTAVRRVPSGARAAAHPRPRAEPCCGHSRSRSAGRHRPNRSAPDGSVAQVGQAAGAGATVGLCRRAQFRWDWAFSENSTGFHHPDRIRAMLTEAQQMTKQARAVLPAYAGH